MSVRKCFSLIFSLTITLMLVRSAVAQSEARIQVIQTGVDELKKDLKYLVELSPNPNLKKQWKGTLEDLLDSFAQGIDPTLPIRVDIIVGKEVSYEVHLPIKALPGKNGFLENLKGLNFKEIKTLGPGLYSLAADKKTPPKYFLRYTNGYASIATSQAAIPANLPPPIKAVQPLLDLKYDVVASLKNGAAPKDLAARKANFQELRRQLEAAVVFKRGEDKDVYALRKLTLQQDLNEVERFVVEAEDLLVGWTTTIGANGMPGKGRAELSVSALPNTDLSKSVAILADKSSYFANVQLNANAVVSGKTNFAIDPLRVGHLQDFYKAVLPVVEAQIDKRTSLGAAAQKAAAKNAAKILLDILNDATKLNVADLFLDMHPVANGHTLICGFRSDNGKKADAILQLLNQVDANRDVKMGIQQIGEVTVHSVSILPRRLEAFQKVFPGEKVIYVATSKDAIWGAAGSNAIEELKVAIGQVAAPAPDTVDPRIAYFTANAARLFDLMEIVRPEPQKNDEGLSKEELSRLKQREKDLDQIRKLFVAAVANCDPVFSGEFKKNGNKIEGWLDVSECVLSFIGSVTAEFAKTMQ